MPDDKTNREKGIKMKIQKQNIWNTMAYLGCIFLVSFFMTILSVACIAKDMTVFANYQVNNGFLHTGNAIFLYRQA